MKKLSLIAISTVSLLALSGCAPSETNRWSAGSGEIKIVASTNVWGSVANLVAGDLATVDAIIYNTNQDPHSYELTARDQLLINNADIVIMNGGGYDDFIQQAVDADSTPAITVNAFMASGDDETRNEHIWYDVDQTGDVAAVIAAAIESLDESKTEEVEARVADFREKLAERKAQLEALRAEPKTVFATEPLIDYLLEDAGYENLTPEPFMEAIEEDTDVPPAAMQESKDIMASGRVDFVCLNESTKTPQIEELLKANANVSVFGFGELLIQDPDTLEYDGGYFEIIDAAIMALKGK
jgi:zinc/manganese transport system substrate-binding protein